MRAQRRNLDGDMVIEGTSARKELIQLMHQGAYIKYDQRDEITRFFNMAAGFYLLAAIDNRDHVVEKVWKVVFAEPPSFNQLAPGREDYYTTNLSFLEV